MMDNQQLFNMVVCVAGFLAVYTLNNLTRKIQRFEDEFKTLPHDYVQKDDYRADMRDIKDLLKQIFDKLDNKQDK